MLHFANSAEDALQMLADGIRPELIVILSDINMSGTDGLASLCEKKKTWPGLPIVTVTAYGDEERRRRASEHGAAAFITKSADFEFLKRQLENGTTAETLRHRQTKGAATDMFGLPPLRHTPTLPNPVIAVG